MTISGRAVVRGLPYGSHEHLRRDTAASRFARKASAARLPVCRRLGTERETAASLTQSRANGCRLTESRVLRRCGAPGASGVGIVM